MRKKLELGKKAKVGIIVAILLTATIAAVWYLRQQSQQLQSQNQITITISPTQIITAPGNLTTFTVTVSGPTDWIAVIYNDGTEPEAYRVNGNAGTTIQINHTFMAEGKYRVVVVALPESGATEGKISFPNVSCEVISTNSPPSVSFTVEGGTYNPNNRTVIVSEGATLTFNASMTDNVEYDLENMRIVWRINGILGQSPNVTVQFNKSGVYPAYVVVIDPWGSIDYEYFFIVVRNYPPVAQFTVDYDNSTGWMVIDADTNTIYTSEDTLLIFNATPSVDNETDLGRLRYIWIFGDGTTGEGAVVNHTYTKNGTYNVTLVVIDPENNRSSVHVTVVVCNEPPGAEIIGPTVLYEGQTYVFRAEVNDTPTDLAFMKYIWGHCDGGWFQTYTPMDDGSYIVNLTVIDDDGVLNSTHLDAIVHNLPPEVYVSFKVWANIHFNITGEGWSDVIISIIRDGAVEQNMTISWNETIGSGPYYTNISYTFYITSDYELNITPIFINTSEDPWIDIQVWFTFDNTSSVPMEAMIYYVDGMPYYTASEREGVFKIYYRNGTWTLWINPEDVADVAPLAIITNAWDPGMDNISILLEYYENETLIASKWVNITNNGTWPTWGTDQWNIIVSENATLKIYAWDDDGANITYTINIYRMKRVGWDVIPEHVPPLLILEAPNETVEDLPTTISIYMIDGEKGEYTVTIDFGDGTAEVLKTNETSINVTHTYNYSGAYLIRVIAEHDGAAATWFAVVVVTNRAPEVHVPDYVNATEGITLSVAAVVTDTEEDQNKTIIGWIVDGKPYVGAVLNYTYPDSGAYNITVIVRDDEGAVDIKNVTIYVEEREPRFASPDRFVADEGNPITLYIWIEDCPLDVLEANITVVFEDNFDWLNPTWIVFDDLPHVNVSSNRVEVYNTTEITFWLDDGEYTLWVIIENGEKTFNRTINVTIHDIKPVILSSVYSYVQPMTETATITLYAYDIYVDMQELNFTIEIPELGYTASIDPIKPSATFQIPMSIVTKSKEYIVKATAADEASQDKKEIKVRMYNDTNNDGAPDEAGLLHLLPDHDGDYLPTIFENVSATWSDPNNPDTDYDGILDGIEYFGWQTEITTKAGKETIWVVSYPNDADSDDDGLDDLYEKQLGTNPLSDDTDMDGLPDPEEVELNTTPTNWDTDNDGLSDGEEVKTYHTDPLSTDTDNDGLTDYDEVHRYGTEPTDNDTDNDGLGDAEEQISLTYSLDQKCNFTGTRTFEIYVPIEYSLSTTITIGLSDVEQGTTIKAWIYYGGQQIKYIEEKPQAQGAWTKAINISREYVKGTWRLKISAPEYVLLDKYQISITTRTDPTKYDTDGDGMGDGKEVKGIDIDGVKIWTNPLLKDTDMDGLSDSKELSIGTNPLSKDTDADGIIDSQDKAPTGNRLLEIRIGEVKVELYKKYVWRYLFGESWGSDRWMEDTLFCVVIDTKYNAFILPYLYGKGRANYQNNPETKAYYVDIPDNVESTTIRLALYIKSGYTTFWIWWHKALEKRVGLSGDWDTLEEKRDVRHINLGFYEEWLRTEARLKYMAKTYPQTFTKIYMVTKPDFVVKPDTEYVVIIMRVDGEFRTIACPREIFLETKLGDIIMETNDDALVAMGLEDADISGFSEGKISPYIYGLITKSDATSTIWNKVVAAITQNTSGVRIASIVQMSRILLPKDIVKMIPLNVLPQQGKSLPEYMSPETSIWAAVVGYVLEKGRQLCGLFVAGIEFLANLAKSAIEWGLKVLGSLVENLGPAKYLFVAALSVVCEVVACVIRLFIGMVYVSMVGMGLSASFDGNVLTVIVDQFVRVEFGIVYRAFHDFMMAHLKIYIVFMASSADLGISSSLGIDIIAGVLPFMPMQITPIIQRSSKKCDGCKATILTDNNINPNITNIWLTSALEKAINLWKYKLVTHISIATALYLGVAISAYIAGMACEANLINTFRIFGVLSIVMSAVISSICMESMLESCRVASEMAPKGALSNASCVMSFLSSATIWLIILSIMFLDFSIPLGFVGELKGSELIEAFTDLGLNIIVILLVRVLSTPASKILSQKIVDITVDLIVAFLSTVLDYFHSFVVKLVFKKMNVEPSLSRRAWGIAFLLMMLPLFLPMLSVMGTYPEVGKYEEALVCVPVIERGYKPEKGSSIDAIKIGNTYNIYAYFNMTIEDTGGICSPAINNITAVLAYKASAILSIDGWNVTVPGYEKVGYFNITHSDIEGLETQQAKINGTYPVVELVGDNTSKNFSKYTIDSIKDKLVIVVFVRDSDRNDVAFIIPVNLSTVGEATTTQTSGGLEVFLVNRVYRDPEYYVGIYRGGRRIVGPCPGEGAGDPVILGIRGGEFRIGGCGATIDLDVFWAFSHGSISFEISGGDAMYLVVVRTSRQCFLYSILFCLLGVAAISCGSLLVKYFRRHR